MRCIQTQEVSPERSKKWTYAQGDARLNGIHRAARSTPEFPAAAIFHRRPNLFPEEDLFTLDGSTPVLRNIYVCSKQDLPRVAPKIVELGGICCSISVADVVDNETRSMAGRYSGFSSQVRAAASGNLRLVEAAKEVRDAVVRGEVAVVDCAKGLHRSVVTALAADPTGEAKICFCSLRHALERRGLNGEGEILTLGKGKDGKPVLVGLRAMSPR